jgi:hypothetical protein
MLEENNGKTTDRTRRNDGVCSIEPSPGMHGFSASTNALPPQKMDPSGGNATRALVTRKLAGTYNAKLQN